MSIDSDELLRIVGGNRALAIELVEMLVSDIPNYRRDLDSALARADLAAVGQIAHTISGGAAYCGASALRRAADRLEETARDRAEPELGERSERVRSELQKILDQFPRPISL